MSAALAVLGGILAGLLLGVGVVAWQVEHSDDVIAPF